MTQPIQKWNFAPHPLLANGHLQSVMGIRWPTKVAPYQATQHPILLDDGDRLMLHEDAPAGADETTPSVLLIHGLAGSHLSTYMCRMAEKLTQRNYRVFRMDMRSCGAGQGIAKLPPHCGLSTDVASALYYMAELFPESATSIVGFSMGGTLTLNMLAEAGDMRVGNLERSFVVCPPIDLAHVEQHFHTFWGRRYDRFFVRLIWAQMLSRWQHFPETAPSKIPKRPRRLREIDELVIAPSGGFTSAEDYYRQTSPGPKMASIKQPLTVVFSEDDPVVPVEPLFDTFRSSSIETVTTHHGGHLGFLAGRHDDPDFRWLDWRIIDWLAAGQTERKVKSATSSFTNHAGEMGLAHPHTKAVQESQPQQSQMQQAQTHQS